MNQLCHRTAPRFLPVLRRSRVTRVLRRLQPAAMCVRQTRCGRRCLVRNHPFQAGTNSLECSPRASVFHSHRGPEIGLDILNCDLLGTRSHRLPRGPKINEWPKMNVTLCISEVQPCGWGVSVFLVLLTRGIGSKETREQNSAVHTSEGYCYGQHLSTAQHSAL